MEVAIIRLGFHHDLNMRFATEIQGETAQENQYRLAQPPTIDRSHEIPADSTRRPTEVSQHLALAAQATNDAIRVWSVTTGALSWPQGLEALLGFSPSSATDNIGFWQKQLHPQDRARAGASIRQAFAEGNDHWTGEYRFRHKDGSYLDLLERACIVRDSLGRPVQLVGSLMNITARKQLQDQLVRSQKMEAFGQLAGGVAHDFNNFLTTIMGYSDLLLMELDAKSEIADHIREIRGAAGRASALTGQLMAFSRKHPLAPAVVDVNSLLGNLERSLLRLLGENISVQCDFERGEAGLHTRVDPGQLTQIVLNLVVNARDAMPAGGRLILETATVTIDPETNHDCSSEELPPGDYVRINVIDNGSGMTEETQQHLFEPFFTTKDAGSSGLGLAASYGIVRQSGGHICVESEIGKGTTVRIFLPKVPAPPPPSYKKPRAKQLPTGTETILVLEDDISVRHLSVRVLRSLGYEVLEAANGDDAQQVITRRNGKIVDLLLTDMVLPQMSGRCFADWMSKTSPDTKVVYISGYLQESLPLDDRRDQEMFFLPKPFDQEQLAAKIRQALDA